MCCAAYVVQTWNLERQYKIPLSIIDANPRPTMQGGYGLLVTHTGNLSMHFCRVAIYLQQLWFLRCCSLAVMIEPALFYETVGISVLNHKEMRMDQDWFLCRGPPGGTGLIHDTVLRNSSSSSIFLCPWGDAQRAWPLAILYHSSYWTAMTSSYWCSGC